MVVRKSGTNKNTMEWIEQKSIAFRWSAFVLSRQMVSSRSNKQQPTAICMGMFLLLLRIKHDIFLALTYIRVLNFICIPKKFFTTF